MKSAQTYCEIGSSVKYLGRVGLTLVKHVPVIDRGICNQTECIYANPLPEEHVLVHGG